MISLLFYFFCSCLILMYFLYYDPLIRNHLLLIIIVPSIIIAIIWSRPSIVDNASSSVMSEQPKSFSKTTYTLILEVEKRVHTRGELKVYLKLQRMSHIPIQPYTNKLQCSTKFFIVLHLNVLTYNSCDMTITSRFMNW